jgi:predicted dehydrogenase
VNRKAFGEITECEIHYDFDFPFWMKSWKDTTYTPGKSMLFGIGSHTIDQALVLFGRPATITGFYRSLRGIESEVDDAFTVILQYGREKINLVGTVKTSVVCVMQYPMKFFVGGIMARSSNTAKIDRKARCLKVSKPRMTVLGLRMRILMDS